MITRITATAFAACLLATAASAQPTQFEVVPNHIKYSDTGIPKAIGRSGNATIESEALLFEDGVTRIMLTTGSIEQPYDSGTGWIDKVLYKTGGSLTHYKNDAPTSWFRLQPTDLVRHQPLQFQVHVRGIDAREDIVTVNDVVKLAPDLMVESVEAPPTAPAGVPVNVSAVVREINGDVGARVICVLFAGNRIADVVEDAWIDANGTVTCAMQYEFPAPGTFTLGVQVNTITPAEYGFSNNFASTQIVVTEPTAPAGAFDSWTATAKQENFDYRSLTTYTDGRREEQDNEGWSTTSRFNGTINAGVDVSSIAFALSESTEGQVIESAGPSLRLAVGSPKPDGSRCASYQLGRFTIGSICSKGNLTTVTFQRGASQAMYVSRAWLEYVDENGNTQIQPGYHIKMPQTSGTRVQYRSSVEMNFTIYAGQQWWDVEPFIPMSPYETRNTQTNTCTATFCREITDRVWGIAGTDTN
ncbi:MAG TPA: hypothetical protein VFV49_06220 [Thermoanaerobaculia bacterium]|nr:hypothetical protein [Thermoanaerobaculia bacterium]